MSSISPSKIAPASLASETPTPQASALTLSEVALTVSHDLPPRDAFHLALTCKKVLSLVGGSRALWPVELALKGPGESKRLALEEPGGESKRPYGSVALPFM
ncbi:MAG TPA: hypothetical protein VFH51_12805 [Myxococcota bacterium]|nr:hypothetical protein [Myxococcota bacterium]